MKLHEEFKLYENMWDTNVAPKAGQPARQTINNSLKKYDFDSKDLQEAVGAEYYTDALDMFMHGHKTKGAATKFWLSEIIELDIADDDAVTNELRSLLTDKYVVQHIADMLVLRRLRRNQTLNDIATCDTIENIQEQGLEGDFMVELLNEILDIYNNYKTFTKTSLGESASNKIYSLELTARHYKTDDEYDDEDNIGDFTYQYEGTLSEIVSKLNNIAKTHEFSFVFIFDGDRCVFDASDTDSDTDEEFDVPVIWNNEIVPTGAPFLKSFKQSHKNANTNLTEADTEGSEETKVENLPIVQKLKKLGYTFSPNQSVKNRSRLEINEHALTVLVQGRGEDPTEITFILDSNGKMTYQDMLDQGASKLNILDALDKITLRFKNMAASARIPQKISSEIGKAWLRFIAGIEGSGAELTKVLGHTEDETSASKQTDTTTADTSKLNLDSFEPELKQAMELVLKKLPETTGDPHAIQQFTNELISAYTAATVKKFIK